MSFDKCPVKGSQNGSSLAKRASNGLEAKEEGELVFVSAPTGSELWPPLVLTQASRTPAQGSRNSGRSSNACLSDPWQPIAQTHPSFLLSESGVTLARQPEQPRDLLPLSASCGFLVNSRHLWNQHPSQDRKRFLHPEALLCRAGLSASQPRGPHAGFCRSSSGIRVAEFHADGITWCLLFRIWIHLRCVNH